MSQRERFCLPDLARTEFFLCLARAFLPPQDEAAFNAIKFHLADDLGELAVALGYPAAAVLRDLRKATAGVSNPLTLLQTYSKLFLAPPVPVTLNAGLYLEGALSGPATIAFENCYRQAGLTLKESFHDLPDHIASQLEFAGYLCARQAAGDEMAFTTDDFLASFVRHWVPSFVAALERACAEDPPARVYFGIARLLKAAVDHDLRGYRAPSTRSACELRHIS